MSSIRLIRKVCLTFALLSPIAAFPADSNTDPQDPGLEEIVVTASATPIELRKVGGAITVITGEELQVRGIQYAADALRHVPGIAVNRSGNNGGLTQIRVRGSEANHVLVLIDGVEVAPADTGEVDLSTVLARDIDRIEVLRGPQSGLYGSNALAGVVAIFTRPYQGQPDLRLEAEAGSFESSQLNLSAGVGSRRRNGSLNVTWRESTGLNAAPEGREEDDDEVLSISGRGQYVVAPGMVINASVRYVDKTSETDELDFSGGPRQGLIVDAPGTSETEDRNLSLGFQWTGQDGRWINRVSAARTDTELAGRGTFGGFGSDTGRTRLAVQSTRSFQGARMAHFLTGFAERENETYQNAFPTDPSQLPEFERDLTGLGVEYRTEIDDRLFLSAAVRRDSNDAFDDATTYRLTASRLVTDQGSRAHFSLGKGVTNPTFFEQFGFTPGFFVGNPDLMPEESTAWDLGLEWRFNERLSGDVTYFDARLNDEILAVFPTVVNAGGESDRSGVELSLSGQLSERLSLSAAYTYTDSQDALGQTEVRRPKNTASADVSYRSVSAKAQIYLGLVYTGSVLDNDFRDFYTNGFVAGQARLDAYTLVNLGASYRFSDGMELFGRIDNALDEDYEEVLGYNAMGRGVFIGMRFLLSR